VPPRSSVDAAWLVAGDDGLEAQIEDAAASGLAGREAGLGPARRQTFTLFLCVLAMWVATHPYPGVTHDARLYTLQALHALDPGRWGQDLYFAYGTQDSFTLFTRAYAPLVAGLGLGLANLIASCVGGALWLGAAFALVWSLFKARIERWAAVSGIILLAGWYHVILTYAEPFATPRLYAEAATLAALALALRRRRIAAAVLLAVTAMIHPLVAIYGVCVVALSWATQDRRIWLLICAAAVILAIGVALRIGPLALLWQVYDPTWWRILSAHLTWPLLSKWAPIDQLRAASTLVTLGACAAVANSRERRLTLTVLLVTVAGIVVSLIGTDGAHNVLLASLQLWRGLWLATVAVNIGLPILLLRGPSGATRALLALGMILSVASRFLLVLCTLAPGVLAVASVLLVAQTRLSERWRPVIRFTAWAAAAVAAAAGVAMVAFQPDMEALAAQLTGLGVVMLWVSAPVAIAVGCVLFATRNLSRERRRRVGRLAAMATGAVLAGVALLLSQLGDSMLAVHLTELVLALLAAVGLGLSLRRPDARWLPAVALLVVAGLALADQRSAWARYVEGSGPDGGLSVFLAGADHIYWQGELGSEALWFRARRPSYFGCVQGAEAVFFRGVALEWVRRATALREVGAAKGSDFCGANFSWPSTTSQVVDLCRALPDLDTLVFNHQIEGATGRTWTAPAFQGRASFGLPPTNSRFWRYDCQALR